MTFKVLIAILVLCFNFLIRCQAALVVDPAYITLDLSQDRNSGSFTIKNTGDQEERYRATAKHFIVTAEGGLSEVPPDEYSLANWVKFNPKEFTLPPKSSRLVRFSIVPDTKLKAHEYWGSIEFVPLQVTNVTSADDNGHTFNIQVRSVILVPIYGFSKGTTYSGRIKDINIKKDKDSLYAIATLENTGEGNLRFDGALKIINSKGETAEEIPLPKIMVFTKNSRVLKIKLAKVTVPGSYTARLNFKSSESHSKVEMANETKFSL